MAQIILDFGSATTCKNSLVYVKRMIDELAKVDSRKHDVVIKYQLFEKEIDSLPDGTILDPPVVPLKRDVFNYAYNYAASKGYKTTASVFDLPSLKYLLTYDIPFVKIANRPDIYWLGDEVPEDIPVYYSAGDPTEEQVRGRGQDEFLYCVSKYPATVSAYEDTFPVGGLCYAISDHTTDFTLCHKYNPIIIEWHYKLSDSTGYDAGEFARTPERLKEVL